MKVDTVVAGVGFVFVWVMAGGMFILGVGIAAVLVSAALLYDHGNPQ